MIQSESMVKVADNSGAKTAKVIRILGGSSTKFARIGDKVVVAVRSALPSSQLDKGAIFWAVVVRTKKETRRDDGTFIRFGDNAVALVSRTDEPVGKRIFGPVAKELRKVGYTRIASMAEEVI